MNTNKLILKALSALVALFVLPIALFRVGPRAWLKGAVESIRDAGDEQVSSPSVYLIETHDEATVDGDVRLDLYGIHGHLGMLAVVQCCWESRPEKTNQLVFWVSEGEPMPVALLGERLQCSLGLEHNPRPIAGAEKYINGLVISDSMRGRIRSMLDLACTYTECPGTMKA